MHRTLPPTGILKPGELYTLPAFKYHMALTNSAVRSIRQGGMPVLRCGKRHFVAADDAIRYIRERSSIVS